MKKRIYKFSGWNIAMAMTHISPNNLGNIFPEKEPLKTEEMLPDKLLRKLLYKQKK